MDTLAINMTGEEGGDGLISSLAGEMGGSPEGGAVPPALPVSSTTIRGDHGPREAPPSALPGISPARGEISQLPAFAIVSESFADRAAREALLDRAMGPGRRRKSSETLRRGRLPAEGLAFVAKNGAGAVVGTVRLWDVRAGSVAALLLGPLAVDPSVKFAGIGSALIRRAIDEAARRGHGAILLVGDAPYYRRFGFGAEKTAELAMPGPYERDRFLALELIEGWLLGASGCLEPCGKRDANAGVAVAA